MEITVKFSDNRVIILDSANKKALIVLTEVQAKSLQKVLQAKFGPAT